MKYANLHLHSNYSDGVYTPGELCEKAKQMGYRAVALTDHNTASGCAELFSAAKAEGLECLSGIELIAEGFGESFHIVGLDFDPTSRELCEYTDRLKRNAYRKTRAKFEALRDSDFLRGISWEEIEANSPDGACFCNEQIFAALAAKNKFRQEDFWSCFFRYKAMRVEYQKEEVDSSAEHVISLIRSAGGIAVLAHPHNQLKYLDELCRLGLSGVEYDHPELSEDESLEAVRFAKANRLYLSGGTDHFGRLGDYTDIRGDFPAAHELAGGDLYRPLSFDARNGTTEKEYFALTERIFA